MRECGNDVRHHRRLAGVYKDGSSTPFSVCLKVTTKARPSPVLRVSYLKTIGTHTLKQNATSRDASVDVLLGGCRQISVDYFPRAYVQCRRLGRGGGG